MTAPAPKCSKGWGARCAASKGSRCTCACGGANHGGGRHPGDRQESLSGCRARYAIVQDTPGSSLIIRDLGPWDQHPTVTNDAEAVVRELVAEGRLPEGRTLLYFDSGDRLDEIVVRGGVFAGFAPGGV